MNDDGSLPTGTRFAIKMPAVNKEEGAKLSVYNTPTAAEDDKTEGETEKAAATETLVGTFDITNSLEEKIEKEFFEAERSFVFRYRRKALYALGQYQIFAVDKLRNRNPTAKEKEDDIKKHGTKDISYTIIPDSPFAIERIGERLQSFQGGD